VCGLHFAAETNKAICINADGLPGFGLIAQSDLPTIFRGLARNQDNIPIG